MTCRHCKGTGELSPWQDCYYCDGTGGRRKPTALPQPTPVLGKVTHSPEPQQIDRVVRNLVTHLSSAKTSTGYCCCGSREEDHGFGSGHTYTDEGDYYSWLVISDAEQLLGYHLLDKPGTPSVRFQIRMLLKTIKEKICG
ncbi:hypothetical protein JXVLWARM_CDS_0096 [Burkholderia phage Bm1]